MSRPLDTLKRYFAGSPARPADGDAELLTRYAQQADEAAFTLLVQRHAGMVYRVCRGVLGNDHDAEDATQAAFLVLARNAGTIRRRDSAASWLHGVALRTAGSYRRRQTRRKAREEARVQPSPQRDAFDELSVREAREILHIELDQLPPQYKETLIRIYLEEQSHEDAAAALGVTPTVFRGRLERARAKLAERLARRKLTLAAVLATSLMTMTIPSGLAATTAGTTLTIVAGGTGPAVSAGVLSPVAANVAVEVTAATAPGWTNTILGIAATAVLGGGAAFVVLPNPEPKSIPSQSALVKAKAPVRTDMPGRLLTANGDTFFLINAPDQGAHAISPPIADGIITRFAASPAGTELVFQRETADGRVLLHRWNYSGPFPGPTIGPAACFFWSADGATLFLSSPGKLERIGDASTLIFPSNFPANATAVDVSPNGDRFLIAVAMADTKTCNLELLNPTTNDRAALGITTTIEQSKYWRFDPEGLRLAGPLDVGVTFLNLETKERKRLPGTPFADLFGWSADGAELIVGIVGPGGFERITTIRADDPTAKPTNYYPGLGRQRTDGTTVIQYPTWAGRP